MAKKKHTKCRPYSSVDPGTPFNLGALSENPLTVKGRRYSKHENHWYEEGNIAFLVGKIAFRLHESVLFRRCPGLELHVACLLQPSSPNDFTESDNTEIIIGGLPFYELDDKVEDFAHVLDFIYPSNLPAARTKHLDAHDLMGMVRLAGKYRIQDLLDWAVSKLGAEFLLRPDHRSVAKPLMDKDRYSNPEFCVQVIQFARECSLPQFLPLAFYALATMDWGAHPGSITCLGHLSQKDQCRVQEGRLALAKEVCRTAFTMPENHGAGSKCIPFLCGTIHPRMWTYAEARWESLMFHPLEELENRLTLAYAPLCVNCKAAIKRRTQTFRDSLLQRLPDFFSLR